MKKINVKVIPTEQEEQIAFVEYLQRKGIKHFHVPNSTYTTSWNQKRNNKAMGVQSGIPDLFVVVDDQLLAIEMKRAERGRSRVSVTQKEWITILQRCGIPAKVCFGAQDAIRFVEGAQEGHL